MRICALFFSLTLLIWSAQARILTPCEAVKELIIAKVSRTFINHYICVIQNESGFDTRKITGPKGQSNYFYGIFQISSDKWCIRGRQGGLCNKKCEDFSDDKIQDDIACAKIIVEKEGFKNWNGWMKKCKNQNPPDYISGCKPRRRREAGI